MNSVLLVVALAVVSASAVSIPLRQNPETICIGQENFLRIPDVGSCFYYFQCYSGRAYLMQCPLDTWFNEQDQICDRTEAPEECSLDVTPGPEEDIETNTEPESESEFEPEQEAEGDSEMEEEIEVGSEDDKQYQNDHRKDHDYDNDNEHDHDHEHDQDHDHDYDYEHEQNHDHDREHEHRHELNIEPFPMPYEEGDEGSGEILISYEDGVALVGLMRARFIEQQQQQDIKNEDNENNEFKRYRRSVSKRDAKFGSFNGNVYVDNDNNRQDVSPNKIEENRREMFYYQYWILE